MNLVVKAADVMFLKVNISIHSLLFQMRNNKLLNKYIDCIKLKY